MKSSYYVYIITNAKRTTLYIGVTKNLGRRMYEHRNELIKGFSSKYKLKYLIYLEEFTNINDALSREKQLKNWHRDWKINLIKESNPEMKSLDAETSSA